MPFTTSCTLHNDNSRFSATQDFSTLHWTYRQKCGKHCRRSFGAAVLPL
uniref:Uncharacterized protein n=1 Tax=Anguilla anguilla TaxID=7936 RepID=A0A0E9V2Q6_ANGAN